MNVALAWQLASDGKSLYLGNVTIAEQNIPEFPDKTAVRFVDVVPQFKPEILPHHTTNSENCKVIVFTGASGHGKSTQINAFISYLLGGGKTPLIVDNPDF